MAAAASSARALILLLRPRQHLLPLRVHFAFAAARLPERRCFLLLRQQPHRCWAAIGAAASRGGSRCGDGYPQPQTPAVCPEPEAAPAPPTHEEGEAACGSKKAAGTWDADAGTGAPPPSAPEALRAATMRQANRAAAPAKRKGKKGGPAPPSGGRKEGRGGQGGVHN